MSETLLIHYSIDQEHQATWSLCNDAGELTGKITTGSLEELGEFSANRPAILLLDSRCLHINQLQLPTQNPQKMLRAVPYALEELIAGDIDEFHFVIARNKHNDYTSVVGIDKQTLEKIVQAFSLARIHLERIIPDVICMAATVEQWVGLNYKENTYLQTDRNNGLVISHEIFPYVIENKLNDEELVTPKKILLFSEHDNATAFEQLKIDKPDIEIINIVYNTHPLVVFCGHYKQALALNLLQHKFKPKRKTSGYWQHWRLAASLAAIWLVLLLGVTGFKISALHDENNIASIEIEKIYKKTFPQSKKIINPRVQMEQKLNELKNSSGNASNGLLFLLAESFGTMSQDKTNITLQTLNYRNNRMDIGLDGTNLQAIENLNKNLNRNPKIKSEISSSSAEKNTVKGNLRIEGRS